MARGVEVSSPLGPGVLSLYRMVAREELGEVFKFELELYSANRQIKLDDVLGKTLTVTLAFPGGLTRHFHGYVARFKQIAKSEAGYAWYTAELRPWFWLLTRASDGYIFQNKKVPDIIKEVFDDDGFTDCKNKLNGTYREWEYCVQYCETDFNFVSRLMEQEGFYYYFEHAKNKHNLILADGTNSHAKIEGLSKIPYREIDRQGDYGRQSIYQWEIEHQVQPGSFALNDFDFQRPKADLQSKSRIKRSHAQSSFEMYEYPGEYVTSSEGEAYAKARIEELQAQYELIQGTTNVPGMAVGGLFEMVDYPRKDQNREYLVTSATHEITVSLEIDTGTEFGAHYVCNFTAIDSKQQFRQQRKTPKPYIRGPQTAIVVGKKGEEIWTDELGRVKVQFHWDRWGKSDEKSSCWIRVAQLWAGKSWGGIHIPRIGQEVIVEFLEGDPDRPIITGCVYNGDNSVPYTLPANQTQSGVKSRSTKKGDAKTFNELRFEDKKDSEEIYFHAEKDFVRIVENNDTLEVGLEKKDKGDQTIKIHNHRTVTLVQGDDTLTIEKGKGTIEAAKSIELKVGSSSIKIEPSKITLKSSEIAIQGDMKLSATSKATEVSGTGTLTLKGGTVMIN